MFISKRNFLKTMGSLTIASAFSPARASSDQKPSGAKSFNPQKRQPFDVDQYLNHLKRSSSPFPSFNAKYYSSHHRIILQLNELDLKNEQASFLVISDPESEQAESYVQFEVLQEQDRIFFDSTEHSYHFFWKPDFGLYSLETATSRRILELCHPIDNDLPALNNSDVTVELSEEDKFYSSRVRKILVEEGAPPSPLPGLEGFAEESLYFDASDQRDEKIGRGFDKLLNSLPFGKISLQKLAKISPRSAVYVLEKLIPTVFGWMIGPSTNPEEGKLVLSNCPYRLRTGTYPCESTCGHAMAKYFTEEIGVPLQFDPTIDNYKTCHILIGDRK